MRRTRRLRHGLLALSAAIALSHTAGAVTVTTSVNTNATSLASILGGSGITISNATLSTDTSGGVGTFTGGLAAGLGIAQGVVLTSGVLSCVPGPNDSNSCTGGGSYSVLEFDFVSTTGSLFFNYVFGSEEYNEFVGSGFNDSFSLLVDGVNVALVPGGGGVVSINNVNSGSNSSYFRDNWGTGALDMQYDGFTTVLTAAALGLSAGTHHMEFRIYDVGDTSYDSGVFIQASSFSNQVTPTVPLPAAVWLFSGGLGMLGLLRRRIKG